MRNLSFILVSLLVLSSNGYAGNSGLEDTDMGKVELTCEGRVFNQNADVALSPEKKFVVINPRFKASTELIKLQDSQEIVRFGTLAAVVNKSINSEKEIWISVKRDASRANDFPEDISYTGGEATKNGLGLQLTTKVDGYNFQVRCKEAN
jgi:hypothetical protein